jgi:hypothetical protein
MHRIDMFDVFVCYMHACMHRIAMYDVFVCYMHALDVFEVIYMNIYVFAILKCRELMKNKKTEKTGGSFSCVCARQRTIWSLCRAHTHGKEPTWVPPWELARCAGSAFAVRVVPATHGKVIPHGNLMTHGKAVAHGKVLPHGKGTPHGKVTGARQSHTARQSSRRTAKPHRTAKSTAHGNVHLHGKAMLTHGNENMARQRALPCV